MLMCVATHLGMPAPQRPQPAAEPPSNGLQFIPPASEPSTHVQPAPRSVDDADWRQPIKKVAVVDMDAAFASSPLLAREELDTVSKCAPEASDAQFALAAVKFIAVLIKRKQESCASRPSSAK